MDTLRFNDEWHEDRELDGGERIRMRLLRPEDADRVAKGFSSLSPESRYLRCLRAVKDLSPGELHYMTDCDGIDHFAIAVLLLDDDDQETDSVGIARFVRCMDDPEAAEIAITVLDDFQGRGIGGLLMRRLLSAMGERGYRSARGIMHPDNTAMTKLVAKGGIDVKRENEDGLVRFAIPVPSTLPWPMHLPKDAGRALARMLKIARTGAITLPRSYPLKMAERVVEDWRPHLDEFRDRMDWITDSESPPPAED